MKKGQTNRASHLLFPFLLILGLTACGGGGSSSGDTTPPAPIDLWTWMSGSDVGNQAGVYGTKGMVDATNMPGARSGAVSWNDSGGNLWLLGGSVIMPKLNDLWKYDGTNWTWMSGSNVGNQPGVYASATAADNVPGARNYAVSWIDSGDNLWLFGGRGYDSVGAAGELNDLWKYDGTNWTCVSGSDVVNQAGTYGTQGTADPANVPGARSGAVSWIDSSDNLWLFGGHGYDSVGAVGELNDLWKYDGTNWTWVSGSDVVNQSGVYGTQGTVNSANVPSARGSSISWVDSNGNFWLFGGRGYDSVGAAGRLNDLWKYDGTNWIWVSGSDTRNQIGVYAGATTADNMPGARGYAVSWIDSGDNLWLFGGSGYDAVGRLGDLNDLWKYDGNNWTWMRGSDVVYQSSVYGTKGVSDADNTVGGRKHAISWRDMSDNLWLFGGHAGATEGVVHNDLWRYQP